MAKIYKGAVLVLLVLVFCLGYVDLGFIYAEGEANNVPELLIEPSISLANPNTTDNLSLNYGYFDKDNDLENGTLIKWYKVDNPEPVTSGQIVPGDQSAKVLPTSFTTKGEQWYATVQPKDGKDYGQVYNSNTVTISNFPPIISGGVEISPGSPGSSDDLLVSYSFYDFDVQDTEEGTEIRWYKNDVLQPSANDLINIPSELTAPGQRWKVTVKPKDGEDFGQIYQSGPVTIGNLAPSALNARISPETPGTESGLEVIYDYHDPEQDDQSGTQIRWYQDGICQEDLNDQSNVPPSHTERGQQWYANITPSDGENLGETVTTGIVEIANTIPLLSSVKLDPQAANTGENLILNYIYSDADNDEETETEIKWYKGGTEQKQLQNYKEVSSSSTEMGQKWKAEVRVSDGYQFSELYQTQEIEIINSRPQARNVTISPNQPCPEDDLVVNYEYWDADGHQQASSNIRWYKDGKLEDEWEGLSRVECDATREGEVWQAEIEPHDGLEYGIAVKSSLVTIKATFTQHMPAIQTNILQTKQEQDHIDNIDDKKKEEKTVPKLRAVRLYGRQQVSLHQGNIELEFRQPCKDTHLRLESSIISDKQSYPLADYLGWDSDIYTIRFSKSLEQSYKLKIRNNSGPSRALMAYWSQEDKNWIIIRDAEAGNGYVEAMVGRHQQITICVLKLNNVTRHLNLNGSRQAFMGLGPNLLKFLLPSGLQEEVSLEVKAIRRNQQDTEVLLFSVLDRYHKPLDSTIDIEVLCCSPQGQPFGLSEVLVNGKTTPLKGKTTACGVRQTQVRAGRFFVLNCH